MQNFKKKETIPYFIDSASYRPIEINSSHNTNSTDKFYEIVR